jgi:hypothetical protein
LKSSTSLFPSLPASSQLYRVAMADHRPELDRRIEELSAAAESSFLTLDSTSLTAWVS